MQLNPGTQYSIVRQLDDANDPSTYYVRAVIKFSNTGIVWKTINLTDLGNQRFVGSYVTPTDGTNGVQIDITVSVYTDSNYTQLSPVYSTTNTEYFVSQLFNQYLGFSGGNDSLSKEDIFAIVKSAMEGRPMPRGLELEDIEETMNKNLEPYLNTFHDSITELHDKHDNLGSEMVKMNKNHEESVKNIQKMFYTELLSAVKDLKDSIYENNSIMKEEMLKSFIESMKESVKTIVEEGIMTQREANKKISELQSTFEISFNKVVKTKERIKRRNLEKLLNNIKSQIEETGDIDIIDNEPENNYKLKALKLLN